MLGGQRFARIFVVHVRLEHNGWRGCWRWPLCVELQEASEHFVADLVGSAVAGGLLAGARLLFVFDLVVDEEIAVGGNAGPAVSFEDGERKDRDEVRRFVQFLRSTN